MHDYAVFGHDRASIGRWLGIAAILIAGGAAQLFAWAQSMTGLEAFTKATITTGATYFLLHWIFNRWAWKFDVFNIPDLNGTWSIEGRTLGEAGETKYEWDGTIGIEQTWKTMLVHLKTAKSQSHSYTATLSKRDGPIGGWLLSYSYRNEPEVEQSHELNSHKGYCEIELSSDLKFGKAAYFNSGGRRTFGTIQLKRKFS